MGMKQTKAPSLFLFFLKYLIAFCTACLFVAAISLFGYFFSISSGFILPANYAERQLQQAMEQIESSDPFDADLIPFTCTYALLDKNGNRIDGNMKPSSIEEGKAILSGKKNTGFDYYFLAERKDGYCLISYDVASHFASPTLHQIVPNPELLLIVLLIGGFILLTIVTAMLCGNKLKVQLAPLVAATNAIKEQELTFKVTPTKVKEFNAVLDSIEDMRVALKTSLERQWEEEQQRRTQMAALTHDIKTPLTIVKGNAELLLESELTGEPLELASTIHNSAENMEQYLALLMDTAIVDTPSTFTGEEFSLDLLIAELSTQTKALCLTKQLCFMLHRQDLPQTFYGDKTLIFRGLINILDNAAEYSPLGGEISLTVRYGDKTLDFIIEDQGKGFSAASLKQATKQFYTQQQERSGKHYGMGLFLAKSVAEQHGGTLTIANKSERGAIVTFTIRNYNG